MMKKGPQCTTNVLCMIRGFVGNKAFRGKRGEKRNQMRWENAAFMRTGHSVAALLSTRKLSDFIPRGRIHPTSLFVVSRRLAFICTAHKGGCQINRNDNRRTTPPRMALPSWKGRFTPADSLVKDLAAPEIVKAEEHREGEGPLEKNVFEFVINMNTRIVCTLKLNALLDMS